MDEIRTKGLIAGSTAPMGNQGPPGSPCPVAESRRRPASTAAAGWWATIAERNRPIISSPMLREDGEEAPFCGVFFTENREGYIPAGLCGLPLFKGGAKFESGTGWPSFTAPFAEEHLRDISDTSYGMVRSLGAEQCPDVVGLSLRCTSIGGVTPMPFHRVARSAGHLLIALVFLRAVPGAERLSFCDISPGLRARAISR